MAATLAELAIDSSGYALAGYEFPMNVGVAPTCHVKVGDPPLEISLDSMEMWVVRY